MNIFKKMKKVIEKQNAQAKEKIKTTDNKERVNADYLIEFANEVPRANVPRISVLRSARCYWEELGALTEDYKRVRY